MTTSFSPASTYAVGSYPTSTSVADVNGDGAPDLVVANYLGSTVSVLLGDGSGSFSAQHTYAAGGTPYSVTTADVNGDGKSDLLVVNNNNNIVSVLLGDGSGSFSAPQAYVVGGSPESVTAADVNHDGKLDLAVGNYTGNSVSVLLGNGSGSFSAQQTYAVGSGPYSITTADVNRDGTLDLVVATVRDNSVSVLLGNGSGSFSAQHAYAAGSYPSWVTAADVNHDGKPDLIVADLTGNTVSVLLGNGSGSFSALQTYAAGGAPRAVTTADVDQDGKLDLVTANQDGTMSVLLGNGSGSFSARQTYATAGLLPWSVAAADLNRDGLPDIVAVNYYGGTASVLLNASRPSIAATAIGASVAGGGTTIGAGRTVTFTVTLSQAAQVTNGTPILTLTDGGTAAYAGGAGTNTLTFTSVVGAGQNTNNLAATSLGLNGATIGVPASFGFQAATTYAAGANPSSVTTADVNGDGTLDMVVANYNGNSISVLLGDGSGGFSAQQIYSAGSEPQVVTTADVNGDGKLDMIVDNYGDGSVSVLLGNGSGSFSAQHTYAAGAQPCSVTTADVNGDGKLDLVAGNAFVDTISVMLGNGAGAFSAAHTYAVGGSPNAVTAGDLNHDGKLDLVGTDNVGDVSVLLGNGAGAFSAAQTYAAGGVPNAVTLADLNQDGRLDLVTANTNGSVSVLLGNGAGGFSAAQTYSAGSYLKAVTTADMNQDGKLDLVVADEGGSGSVDVLLGDGSGGFSAAQTYAAGQVPASVTTADVNGDGRLDLVAADYRGGVNVLLNASTPGASLSTSSVSGSTPGSATGIVVDTTAPNAPFAPNLATASDSGASSNDGVTNVTTPMISGAAEDGSTVTLYDTDGTTVLGTATAFRNPQDPNPFGVYTVHASALNPGSHTLTVTATDAAGNVSAASAGTTVTIDTTAPSAPAAPSLSPSYDTGASHTDGVTSVTAPVITGTAEAGSTVTLYDTNGTTVLGRHTTDTGGLYAIVASTLAEGAHTLTVKATDAAGNVSAASSGSVVTIDTTAPSAPAAPSLSPSSDSGGSHTDGITNVTTPAVIGTAEAGSTVTLYDTNGTSVLGTATATGGLYSITSSSLSPGAHTLTVRATDLAGNVGAASAGGVVTIDTTAPSVPGPVTLDAPSDSGIPGDGITNHATFTLTGTADAGSLVTLSGSNGQIGGLGRTTADTTGHWSFTPSHTAPDGTYGIVATASDTAGNVSSASAAFSLTIDTTPPSAPAAPSLSPSYDSGASSGDGITSATTPVITGTAEDGSTVTLYDTDGTTVLGTATATGGNYAITASTLAEGAHTLVVTATDAAGNVSAASAGLALTIDTTAPSAPAAPSLAPSSDSGASSSDSVTSVTTPAFIGTAEAGSLVTLYDNDGATVVGTATATAGGSYSIVASTLAEGAHTLVVKATDAAGNVSAASARQGVVIETTPPPAPGPVTLDAASDSGASSGDGITNVTTPLITGTVLNNSTVTLYDTDGTTVLGTATPNSGRYFVASSILYRHYSITTSTLAEGSHTLTVRATDTAGNVGMASTGSVVTVDTTAPGAPAAPRLSSASDTGASSSDGVTSVATPVITGTAEDGSTVTLYDTDGTSVLGTATATGGSYSITSSTLGQGSHRLSVTSTDLAGNVGMVSAGLALTIDTTAPSAPAAPTLAPSSDSGASSSDGVTSVATPVITGTAEAGSTVTLYDTDGTTVLGTAMVADDGNYSITASALSSGAHTLTVTATDTAGNVGMASAGLAVTIDTTAPGTPAVPTLAAASDTGAAGDGLTSVATPLITGTAEAGSTVTLYDTDGTTALGTAVATGGSYSIISSTLVEGAHSLTVEATDAAGNVGMASAGLAVTIDTTAPGTPAAPTLAAASDTGAAGDGLTSVATPVITGTAEAGSLVTLYDTDGTTALGTAVATGGSYSIISSTLVEGAHSLTVEATDAAGNVGMASAGLAVTIDATAPGTPAAPTLAAASDSGAAGDGLTSVATPLITGTAEAGSTVTLYDTDGTTALGTAVATGGSYSISASTLAEGAHGLIVTATDLAGNVSAESSGLALTIDATAPSAPAAPTLAAASDSGAAGDGLTSVATPLITGTAEAGSTVTLYDTDGTTALGTAVATGGSYSISASTLAEGAHGLIVTATDLAGNVSAESSGLALTIDATAPAAPAAPTIAAASDTGAAGDGLTSVATPLITGTAEAGSLVTLYDTDGTTALGTAVATGGSYSIISSTLAEGAHSLTVDATDAAGNVGAESPALAVTIDTTAPLVSITQTGGTVAQATQTLSGTVVSGAGAPAVSGTVLNLYDNGASAPIGTASVAADGTWNTSVTLAVGSHSIVAADTDLAGNTGSSGATAYTVAPPAVAATTSVAPTVAATTGVAPTGPSTYSGHGIDGYIVGATVFADTNGNGVLDPGEPSTTTDAQGGYTLVANPASLVLVGGIDSATGLPFRSSITAPANALVISPLTTLVTQLAAANGGNVASAQAQVLMAFNLPASINLTTLDPEAGTLGGDSAASAALTAGALVQNTASLLGAGGAASPYAALAAAIAGQGGAVDLTNAATLNTLAATAGLSGAAAAATTAIAQASNALLTRSAAGAADPVALFNAVTASSIAAQGNASTALAAAVASTNPQALAKATAAFTGTQLGDLVTKNQGLVRLPGSGGGAPTLDATPPAVSFTQDVAFTDRRHAVLTGTFSQNASNVGLSSIEVFNGTRNLGAATVTADGTWSLNATFAPGFHGALSVTATDPLGDATTTSASFTLTTGLKASPYSTLEQDFDGTGALVGETFTNKDGSLYAHDTIKTLSSGNEVTQYTDGSWFETGQHTSYTQVDAPDWGGMIYGQYAERDGTHITTGVGDNIVIVAAENDTLTANGSGDRFVFSAHPGQSMVTDFIASGAAHDVLSLSNHDFATIADVLRHTTSGADGSAVIHVTSTDSITLRNVSAADLAAHPQDFKLHR